MASGCPICENTSASRTAHANVHGLTIVVIVRCPTCGTVSLSAQATARLDRGLYTEHQFKTIAAAIASLDEAARAEVIDAGQLDRLARFGADGW
jgi:hypothetical protein